MIYDNLSEISKRYKESIIEAIDIILSFKIIDLRKIILFGSCARLDITVASDIDLLIVTDKSIRDRIIKSELRSRGEELSTEIVADMVFATTEMIKSSEMKLFEFIRDEGIVLWKDGEFTDEYIQLL